MVNQEHSGNGDNVAGDKYEYIIRSIQARDLMSVAESIMRDVCYRELDKAREKLNVLSGISALENDVQLLLKAISVKVEIVKSSDLPSKSDLVSLLNKNVLSEDVREVVTSILLDLESRNSERVARERYFNLQGYGLYTKEVFYERLASKEELNDSYQCSTVFDFSEQELTGLVRGAIRVEDFRLAFEVAQLLDEHFTSSNSEILLLYTEACLLLTQNPHRYYVSLSKKEKDNVDSIIEKLLIIIAKKDDDRNIATLVNLLRLTHFSDTRLYRLAKLHLDKIRKLSPECAEYIEEFSQGVSSQETKFELISESLDLEQFARLDFALQNDQIKVNTVNKWVERGGTVRTGDDYINSFFDLFLRASVCSADNIEEVQLLDERAQHFFELDSERFVLINPNAMLRLCDKFIELGLPLNTVKYLEPFLSDEAWVSPLFICYLNALLASEKFYLFLSKTKHLGDDDKTESIFLGEAQIYERLNKHDLSIASARAAIKKSPNNPYSWHLLLYVSRKKGINKEELREIVFEIPEKIFLTYSDSKVPLVNEIATYIDVNIADRVLVDWFAKSPDKVAIALTQIHFNSMRNRPEVTNNPYMPNHCLDGVTYSDGFDTFTRLLVRDVDSNHPLLLDVESPLGKILDGMREGATSDFYTMIERLSPYVAAYRYATEIRNKGNDGTDPFRMFTVPTGEGELFPYVESILKRYSQKEKEVDEVLQNPNLPLMMRGHYTNKGNPVKGAIAHLSSNVSTQHMRLFAGGEERPDKVIVDLYTAVYLSLMGFASSIVNLNFDVILCQHTRKVLESWIEDVLRDDYMSMGVSDKGLYRITAQDVQRDYFEFIKNLRILLENSKVEDLKPVDTPEFLVKMRGVVDEAVYSTFQLSIANSIPLLCVDHLMVGLAHQSGYPVVNMNSIVMRCLNLMSTKERKLSIQLNLHLGTPVPILYSDIIELSRSHENLDTFLVFKFMQKYGDDINDTGSPLYFLTEIVRNVTAVAYIDGTILNGGKDINPQYDGFAENVFNSCCRSAMKTLSGDTAEQRFATLIYRVVDTPSRVDKYVKLISRLASMFAKGHFLDFNACNDAFASCKSKASKEF